eukprot:jgi/Astpho2/6005/gw1.00084.170.1_t
MWAHQMSVEAYEKLLNRGWRRSGKYLYCPVLDMSCCPPYPIRVDVHRFEADKTASQSGAVGTPAAAPVSACSSLLHGSGRPRRLEVRLVRSSPELVAQEFPLYKCYQVSQHGDLPGKVTPRGFQRFLVDTPLEPVEQADCPPEHCPPSGLGSFHQQYWIDGQLVAVGVLDVLPSLSSSVYFFWDPEIAPLSPGSALQEIEWTQQAARHCPALHFYVMGFYIHSCPKMTYKARFKPSELLCDQRHCWVPLEAVRGALDV